MDHHHFSYHLSRRIIYHSSMYSTSDDVYHHFSWCRHIIHQTVGYIIPYIDNAIHRLYHFSLFISDFHCTLSSTWFFDVRLIADIAISQYSGPQTLRGLTYELTERCLSSISLIWRDHTSASRSKHLFEHLRRNMLYYEWSHDGKVEVSRLWLNCEKVWMKERLIEVWCCCPPRWRTSRHFSFSDPKRRGSSYFIEMGETADPVDLASLLPLSRNHCAWRVSGLIWITIK